MSFNFLGLRSLIYPAPDLASSKKWWSEILGVDPYFDDGGYVGFNLAGYELGLNSWSTELKGPVTYLGVDDLEAAVSKLQDQGARVLLEPMDVGGGIRLADLISPQGEVFGLIFNPHFKLPE
jgi:predicted enzyme related to lactoylglutathione lyase